MGSEGVRDVAGPGTYGKEDWPGLLDCGRGGGDIGQDSGLHPECISWKGASETDSSSTGWLGSALGISTWRREGKEAGWEDGHVNHNAASTASPADPT